MSIIIISLCSPNTGCLTTHFSGSGKAIQYLFTGGMVHYLKFIPNKGLELKATVELSRPCAVNKSYATNYNYLSLLTTKPNHTILHKRELFPDISPNSVINRKKSLHSFSMPPVNRFTQLAHSGPRCDMPKYRGDLGTLCLKVNNRGDRTL